MVIYPLCPHDSSDKSWWILLYFIITWYSHSNPIQTPWTNITLLVINDNFKWVNHHFWLVNHHFLIGTSLHFPCCQTSNCFPELGSWSAVRTRLLWGCITLKTATKSAAVHAHLALLGPDGMGRDEELGRLGKWLVFTHRNGVFTTKKCGFHPQLCKRTHIFSCSGTFWSTNLAMANDPLYNWVNHHENHLYLWAIASYMQFFFGSWLNHPKSPSKM